MAHSTPPDTRKPSFKAQYTYRSREYRTPSPPRRFVEPVSPSPHDPAPYRHTLDHGRKRKGYYDLENNIKEETDSAQWNDALLRRRYNTSSASPLRIVAGANALGQEKSHPSALDVFAAVATSPQLDSFPPRVQHASIARNWGQSLPRAANRDFHRASKRTKSESFDLHSALTSSERPATSHLGHGAWSLQAKHTEAVFVPETRQSRASLISADLPVVTSSLEEDAELLLGFSLASRAASSRQAIEPTHHYYSPEQKIVVPPSFQSHGLSTGQHTHDRHIQPLQESQLHNATMAGEQQRHSYNVLQELNVQGPVTQVLEGHHHRLPQNTPLGRPRASPITPTDTPENDSSLIDTTDKKGRVYRGWPKGKPRGPRNTTSDTKKPKKAGGSKRASTTSRSKKGKNGVSTVPTPAEDAPLPRRKSFSGLSRTCSFEIESSSGSASRSRSVPPTTHMVIRTLTGEATQADKIIENVCGSCHQTKNAANGNHDYWISCNGCERWFHTTCAGFETERKVKEVDKFFCQDCEPKFGPTTYVRKSTRAHASVDYAGLHEGKIRTAVDVNEHHYIQPIKDGQIQFQPETFARLPPELATADFFERSGMAEPILIPAELNPRPWANEDLPEGAAAEGVGGDGVLRDDLEYDYVPDHGQDKLDMVIPPGLTVRRVAELYGPDERVEVIDVKLQEGEDRRWNMRQWADYYEDEGEKPVRNVISLEVSQSKLGRLIRRPQVVRDLDLQDSVWPQEESAKGVFPKVQFYCLMSVADSYTDFHIDFGGSSVYYHILKGRKTFFFIPPKPKHLKKYEEWCLSPNQNNVFLGDETKECYRVDLYPGDTMLIPSGWIHAVWTPSTSLVVGGNFLTRMHYGMQIQVNDIEKNTGVGRKFRYPYFQKVMWFAVLQYLQQDPIPTPVVELLCQGDMFGRAMPVWMADQGDEPWVESAPEAFNARYYSKGEIEGLVDLLRYIHRTVLVSLGKAGVTKTVQEAVSRSLPKGYGEPLELLKTFAMWVAWKRGNEKIPTWAYPDSELTEIEGPANAAEKKKAAIAVKRSERQANRDANALLKGSQVSAPQAETKQPAGALPLKKEIVEADARATLEEGASRSFLPRYGVKMGPAQESPTAPPVLENTKPAGVEEPAGGLDMDAVQSTPVSHKPSADAAPVSAASAKGPQILPAHLTPPEVKAEAPVASSSKQPRRQACINCRLSKRRCVHDENGRIDPVKAQEPSIPRGPRGAKRTKDGLDGDSPGFKRAKVEDRHSGASSEGEESTRLQHSNEPSSRGYGQDHSHHILGQHSRALGILPGLLGGAEMESAIDPRLESMGLPVPMATDQSNGEGKKADAPAAAVHGANGTHEQDAGRGNAQPSESTKSTSASHKSSPLTDMEQSPGKDARQEMAAQGTRKRSSARESKPIERFTSGPATSPRQQTSPAASKAGKSDVRSPGKNGMAKAAAEMESPLSTQRRMHAESMASETIVDEAEEEDENERLARELQGQEFGLRRRSNL